MALANVAVSLTSGNAPGDPQYTYRISLDLDGDYQTGGYLTFFATTLKAVIGPGRTVVAINQLSPCGGYKLWYIIATDALQVYQYPGALGPATEVPLHTNLAGVTGCLLEVVCK